MKNNISFRLWGRYALFTDPVTKVGGEKCSYHVPTYEAIKGVLKSIYWKPTLIWHVDKVRVMKPLRTQTKGTKPWSGVVATVWQSTPFSMMWNIRCRRISNGTITNLHWLKIGSTASISTSSKRMLEKGGRQDIFLGTRDCQGYVEPCEFGEG